MNIQTLTILHGENFTMNSQCSNPSATTNGAEGQDAHAAVVKELEDLNGAISAAGLALRLYLKWDDTGHYTLYRDAEPYPEPRSALGMIKLLRLMAFQFRP